MPHRSELALPGSVAFARNGFLVADMLVSAR
jgi:hypothetical protein